MIIKQLLTFLLFVICVQAKAQQLLEIIYNRDGMKFISMSDSNSQFSYYETLMAENPVKKMRHKKLVHHSNIAVQDSTAYWDEVNYPANIKLLIKSDFSTDNWIIYPNTKKILGYNCQLAMQVDAKNDTTLVWFTDSLGNYFAKCYAYSAPGVVMEMQQQINGKGILLKYNAVKIKFEDGTIVFPNTTAVLTVDKWMEYRKGRKKISELNTNKDAIISKKGDKRYFNPNNNGGNYFKTKRQDNQ